MSLRTWFGRHWLAVDVLLAVGFALLDTGATLAGASWWPAHASGLARALLAGLAAFTLAISLLISPAGALTPAHADNVWAPYGTVLAAYGPFYYRRDRRTA